MQDGSLVPSQQLDPLTKPSEERTPPRRYRHPSAEQMNYTLQPSHQKLA
jgi:hypothetical protein